MAGSSQQCWALISAAEGVNHVFICMNTPSAEEIVFIILFICLFVVLLMYVY